MSDDRITAIRERLTHWMEVRGLSQKHLALKAGLGETAVRDILKRPETTDVRLGTLEKLADALDISVLDLLPTSVDRQTIGPMLKVKAAVAAGVWKEAFEWPEDEWLTIPGRPDIDAPLSKRAAMRIDGDSMDQLYPPGSFVEYVTVASDQDIVSGKRVIVLRQSVAGEYEATIKEYFKDSDGRRWLLPKSNNPMHQRPISLSEPDEGIAEIRVLGIVVGSYRPE
ncbi:LexA family protein [Rhizorhabdus histidinilytica]|uniref:LexA family protein n=1 Tax=Rhizorhabdus histidinilytica TaxID=439228 RepID=UPI0032204962